MVNTQPVSGSTKLFVGAVVGAGSFAVVHSLVRLYQAPPDYGWLFLAALTLLSGSFTVKVPSVPASISVSETFIFACVLLFGTPAATITVALDALIMTTWRHRREFHKVLFNATEPTLSIWIASTIFFWFVHAPLRLSPADISDLLGPTVILCVTYFMLNSWLTAVAVGLATKTSISRVWKDHFLWLSLNYFVGASVALLIVQNSPNVGWVTLGIILPLLLISYLTMRSSMGRLEDANRHVSQVDKLYLSTIESLATAVDAKDQVTYGHIRRVQTLAVGMAKAMGLHDSDSLKAIEASALLHDVGKLAVPEHILNKPGQLTASEFEQMKLHARIGAEILSSIEFPYPVVPIVRHHHENWDGTGYPDGLSGQSIPIGARILSVVDCFDALTSDRPYRRRLTDTEALNFLRERKGSMYDPLIVDTFLSVYGEIRSDDVVSVQRYALSEISRSKQPITERTASRYEFPDNQRDADDETLEAPQGSENLLLAHLCRCFPNVSPVIYLVDSSRNELIPTHIGGPHRAKIIKHRICIGKGLSGWVAANRQVIMNSDAALDFGNSIPDLVGKCSMSLPLISLSGVFLGVVTLYGDLQKPFDDRDKAIVEAIAYAWSVTCSRVSLALP